MHIIYLIRLFGKMALTLLAMTRCSTLPNWCAIESRSPLHRAAAVPV